MGFYKIKINNIVNKISRKINGIKYQIKIYNNKSIHKNFDGKTIEVSIAMTCFNQLDYTKNGLKSLIQNTKNQGNIKYKFYLLDDCSTDNTYKEFYNKKNITYYCEEKQMGVNNLWNVACELTKNSDFLILVNNDVKFSKNWSENLISEMIKNRAVASGPITNAPGHIKKQNVRIYLNHYDPSNNDDDINSISDQLENIKSFHHRTLNGFCMAFNIRWLNTLDKPIVSSQDPNFGGEDSLFKQYPCNPLIVPSSFIFHYKQITVSRDNFKSQHYRNIH